MRAKIMNLAKNLISKVPDASVIFQLLIHQILTSQLLASIPRQIFNYILQFWENNPLLRLLYLINYINM